MSARLSHALILKQSKSAARQSYLMADEDYEVPSAATGDNDILTQSVEPAVGLRTYGPLVQAVRETPHLPLTPHVPLVDSHASDEDDATMVASASEHPPATSSSKLLTMPIEMMMEIVERIPLLSDAISFTRALKSAEYDGIVGIVIDTFKEGLMSNILFCKEVFSKAEYKQDPCTPTSLKPQQKDNPEGLTFPALIKQAKEQNKCKQQRCWQAQYSKALVEYRHACMLKSRKNREGKDKPDRVAKKALRIKHGEPENMWTYDQLIKQAEFDTARREELQRARVAAEYKEMAKHDKTECLFKLLRRLRADSNYLSETCRGCGGGNARQFDGPTPPHHDGECLGLHAKQNMIRASDLALLKVKVGLTIGGQMEPWVKPFKLYSGGCFLTRLEADRLCELYHGHTFATAYQKRADGSLSEVDMTNNANLYSHSASLLHAIRQQWQKRRTTVTLFEMTTSPSSIIYNATTTTLQPVLVAFIVDNVNLRIDSPNFWRKHLESNKARIVAGIRDNHTSKRWLVELTSHFWESVLNNELQTVTTRQALDRYHVVRVEGFNKWTDKAPSLFARLTVAASELDSLCFTTHGCYADDIVAADKAEARKNLTSHLIKSAALLHAAQWYDAELFECCIDLVAVFSNVNSLPLDKAETRFNNFFNYAMACINKTQTFINSGTITKIADFPRHTVEIMAANFMQSFLSPSGYHDAFWQDLQVMGSTRRLYLILSRQAYEAVSGLLPEVLQSANEHVALQV
ncbi:hypothetical protein LTR36_005671 [Oleoguttula mirabilis]|uniref:F-box domain-containing protein n=1 Tax=Oleoguttula mirabilis TaxID=1507867 RepID=A0AAV9JEU4_9PEZI|nr:hypothetical protein LTR36_005671 [Oleoguttula mirabilis]